MRIAQKTVRLGISLLAVVALCVLVTGTATSVPEATPTGADGSLGIASTPYADNDPDGLSLQAAHNLIEGAIKGVQAR